LRASIASERAGRGVVIQGVGVLRSGILAVHMPRRPEA